LPISTEAAEALRKGEFMVTRHYLPQRLSYASLNQTSQIQVEVTEGGGLRAKTTQPPREIKTYVNANSETMVRWKTSWFTCADGKATL
jgi:hypothetical protein